MSEQPRARITVRNGRIMLEVTNGKRDVDLRKEAPRAEPLSRENTLDLISQAVAALKRAS